MSATFLLMVVCASIGGGALWVGRWWFRSWFNPLSLYSGVWTLCLCSYEWQLIEYERVSRLAWFYIVTAWFSLYFGGGIALLFGAPQQAPKEFGVSMDRLRRAILWLSAIGGIGLIDQIRVVTHAFGNPLVAVFVNAGDIYRGRIAGDLAWAPYLGSVLYAACCLAGAYTARIGKATAVATLPIVLLAVSNVFAMVRAGVVMAAFLFLVAFYYTPRETRFKLTVSQRIGLASAIVVLVGGFTFVSATRKLGVEFAGMTPEIHEISEYIPVFPSIYGNFSAPPVALSMYLDTPQEQRTGKWGQYTFQPVYHLLSRIGVVPGINTEGESRFEETYYTPVPMNTATYLKNLDSDFGLTGVTLFPFFLGAVMSALIVRVATAGRIVHVVLLANLYLVVVFSFVVNLMALGDWYICAAASVIASVFIDRHKNRSAGALNSPCV